MYTSRLNKRRKRSSKEQNRLREERRAQIQADTEFLRGFVPFAKGDPWLNAWEANFINTMSQLLNHPDGAILSDKQRRVVRMLADKLRYEQGGLPPPDEINPPEDDEDRLAEHDGGMRPEDEEHEVQEDEIADLIIRGSLARG